ncbi:MAG: carbohydrate binding family 9 domain-containing protein [Acidobacteria bacterium]|nr:carbohydrate binding family 9 domain-containing protein [Acidobacteriota bacterium]
MAAEAEDREPGSIRGRIRARDEIDDEDTIWVTINTFHDRRRAYMFVVNPAGVQADGIFTEGAGDDFSWNGIFASGGRKTAKGYAVELAIPFRTLRFRPGADELVWGLHIERIVPRRNEKTSGVQIDRNLPGCPIQAGEIRLRPEGIERAFQAEHRARTHYTPVQPLLVGSFRHRIQQQRRRQAAAWPQPTGDVFAVAKYRRLC